ncbi:MAG TPA: hypothetical protein V6D06_14860 [Trichocoleus sp.]
MNKSLYTEQGLLRLAEIVKRSRGGRSYRDLEALTGVSHATIRRLEKLEVKTPEDSTLQSLAPLTPYSFEELKAIGQERERPEIREYLVAEDVWPIVSSLPANEAARLAKMIIDLLAAGSEVMAENGVHYEH